MTRSLRALVMSAEADRRRDWARYMEALDAWTMQCAGPVATTCALTLGNRCALHDGADVIVYDEDSVTPDLKALLQRLPPASPIVFAMSEHDADGHAFPVATRVCSNT